MARVGGSAKGGLGNVANEVVRSLLQMVTRSGVQAFQTDMQECAASAVLLACRPPHKLC